MRRFATPAGDMTREESAVRDACQQRGLLAF
jgi:hypothetical protein